MKYPHTMCYVTEMASSL